MFEHIKDCCGCSACVAVCPKDCLALERASDGFYRPAFLADNCIDCNLCKKVCPVLQKRKENSFTTKAFGGIANGKDVRLSSSSGGLFTVLSTEILKKGGVVFGAAFDDDFSVHHDAAFSVEEAKRFRGSKYVQSDIKNSFRLVKSFLEDDRWVYFSGTPCQVAGLHFFLGKSYDKLITQDFICHSVPSPLVWDEYKKLRQAEAGGEIADVSFRAKEVGVKGYKLVFKFDNGKTYACGGDDPYMTAFICGMSSQEACFGCKFKGVSRVSDITLADFWGVEDLYPEFDNTDGVSLVLVHSNKGMELFNSCKVSLTYIEAKLDTAFTKNPMAIRCISAHPKRKSFFKVIEKYGFEKAYKKATAKPLKVRLKRRLKLFFKQHK